MRDDEGGGRGWRVELTESLAIYGMAEEMGGERWGILLRLCAREPLFLALVPCSTTSDIAYSY